MRAVLAFALATAAALTRALAVDGYVPPDGTGISDRQSTPGCFTGCIAPTRGGACFDDSDWKCLCADPAFTAPAGMPACLTHDCSASDVGAAFRALEQKCDGGSTSSVLTTASEASSSLSLSSATVLSAIPTVTSVASAPGLSTVLNATASTVTVVVTSEPKSDASVLSLTPVTSLSSALVATATATPLSSTTVTAIAITDVATSAASSGITSSSASSLVSHIAPTIVTAISKSVLEAQTAFPSASSATDKTSAALAHVAPGACALTIALLVQAFLI